MNKAVFLDRDGVITQEPPHYAYRPDQLKIIPRSADAIKLLNLNDYKTIVVSNQAGVAHGYYLEKDVILFNQLMIKELELQNAKIDAIYYCPHHPNAEVEKYKINCDCRKPKLGMLKKAEKELNIDIKQSHMIGDKKSDIDTGNVVGCKTMLVLTGYGMDEVRKYGTRRIKCDVITKDLYEAVKILIKSENFGIYTKYDSKL